MRSTSELELTAEKSAFTNSGVRGQNEEGLLNSSMKITIAVFVILPLLAVIAAIPLAILWAGFFTWVDAGLIILFWAITAGGITLGYHRYFTHGAFKAPRAVKIVLAIAGSMAIQGSLDQWVADHRKHHQFSDEVGDPHSPWRYGTSKRAVAKGLYYAHVGWLFDEAQTPIEQYAPDIAADKDLSRISQFFPAILTASILLPALLGGLITWSWMGALAGLFWGGLIRIALVHHVTWSINSICHVFGSRPFNNRDLSSNVAWLAIPSFGESWHSLHHADPTLARHGVLKGQLDMSARAIRIMESMKMVTDVRWPKPQRIANKLKDPAMRRRVRGYVEPSATE